MPPAKSRSKVEKRYEDTTPINQIFPKPCRYYMGVLFTGDERILFSDALFYHLSSNEVKIVNRDPKSPFDGEVEVEGIPYAKLRRGDEIEIDEIQYAIGIVTGDKSYVYRLFNHECETPGILYLDKNDNLILEAEMETDDEVDDKGNNIMTKEVMGVDSPYSVTQFIN